MSKIGIGIDKAGDFFYLRTDNGERWRWPSIARGLRRPLRRRRRKRRRGQRPNVRSLKSVKKRDTDDNDKWIMLIIRVPISECSIFLIRGV